MNDTVEFGVREYFQLRREIRTEQVDRINEAMREGLLEWSCWRCGKSYTPRSPRQERCDDCRQARHREQARARMAAKRARDRLAAEAED